jgi:glyoxylase-like metal-dependent hydrolase (beta-lactamase superfamily II)
MLGAVATVAAITYGAEAEPTIAVARLTDTLFLLSTDQGSYTTNTIASVGDDGVLLVDTQAEADAEALKKVVDGFGKGAPRIIINTHRHVEHVGGNAIFGDEPLIIAHDLVRTKLQSGSYLFEEFPDTTLPDITLTDSMSVYFNGERIELIAMPGSHDDNEVIVHFTGSKVVHLSSLVNGFNFPSVDSDGDVLKFEELVARAIEILPEDVVIVSGHNQTGTWQDLKAYHEMLVSTTGIVRSGLAEGKDAATLQQEGALDGWQRYAGSYVSLDAWIDTLAAGLQRGDEPQKKTVFEPLYYAWKDGGAEAAIALYAELKKDHADEYLVRDVDLMIIGNKLVEQEEYEAAILFLESSLQQWPESPYAYYANYNLARAHHELGDVETAIRYCDTALEQSPDNRAILKLRQELESGQ